MKISSDFDGGNITVIKADTPDDMQLEIRKDNASDFYQWFYFLVDEVKDESLNIRLLNAGGSAYPDGWTDYRVCVSYDNETWFRVPTELVDGELRWSFTPQHDAVWFAYFAPYPYARHKALIEDISAKDGVSHEVLVKTPDGHNLDLLTMGEGDLPIWVTARQHPGETMAEWWMEGFLGRMTDPEDDVAQKLRQRCTFYIVPNMCPDGGVRGNLRTNAQGANLNREWGVATAEHSPEVLAVTTRMDETGLKLALDVHGDESLPYNFIAGGEGAPGFSPREQALLDKFKANYEKETPAFQSKYGYDVDAPGTANLVIATNYLAHRYRTLAMTLEMPFKDDNNHPDEMFGWSPERSAQLGHDVLPVMLSVVDDL